MLDPLNPHGAPTLEELQQAGVGGGRHVARNDGAFYGYQDRLEQAGLTSCVVLARESFPNNDARFWTDQYSAQCHPTYWQIGNEPDAGLLPAPSPSSWSMTHAEYAWLWRECARAILANQPDARLITAGLVSGQPSWAAGLKPLLTPTPYAWGVHPYGKAAAAARTLLWAYPAPTMVTEWNRPAEEIAAYGAMLEAECLWSAYFCWSDGMVPGFGLIEDEAALAAFKALGGNTMAVDVGQGVVAKMTANGDHPLTDEEFHHNKDGSTWSRTLGTKGWYYAGNASGNWEVVGPFAPAA